MYIVRDPIAFNDSPRSCFTVQQDTKLYMNSVSIDLKVDGDVWCPSVEVDPRNSPEVLDALITDWNAVSERTSNFL